MVALLLSWGSGFVPVLVQTGVAEWKTMLRRFAAGLWGALWIGLRVCLAWFPFRGAWFEGISAGTQAQRMRLHYC